MCLKSALVICTEVWGNPVKGQGKVFMEPVVILVEPQLGENIGACARAMMNCGLGDLRLVNPRDGWPNPSASAMSANATSVVEQAQLFDSLDGALDDLNFVLATTARRRDMIKPTWTARTAAPELAERLKSGQKVGLIFGCERSGLENEHLSRASGLISIPLNPRNSSLNIGQAVLLVGYELFQVRNQFDDETGRRGCKEIVSPSEKEVRLARKTGKSMLASKGELDNFFKRLMLHLEPKGFLDLPDKRLRTERNLRNIFERADLTRQEVMTLHGLVAALARCTCNKNTASLTAQQERKNGCEA